MLRSFDPLSVPRITFGQLGRQAERPETLNDRALQLVIGERIKLDGCADTRDKARGLRSTLRSCQTNCEGDPNGLGGLCHQNLVG